MKGASSPGQFNNMFYIEAFASYQQGSGVVPGSECLLGCF